MKKALFWFFGLCFLILAVISPVRNRIGGLRDGNVGRSRPVVRIVLLLVGVFLVYKGATVKPKVNAENKQ